jgi:hypothetical protein
MDSCVEFKSAWDRRSSEMSAALRAELPLVGRHALGDPRDVRNEPAANHSGVVGAIHALLERTVCGLPASCRPAMIRSNDRREQGHAGKETDF